MKNFLSHRFDRLHTGDLIADIDIVSSPCVPAGRDERGTAGRLILRMNPRIPLRRSHGFTIIEFVVVAIITAIVAVFAIVRYQPSDVNVVAEGDRVRNDLRLMQMAAMTWGTPLRFTPVAGGYSFSCPRTVANTPCSTGTLNAAAALAAGLNSVAFDAQFEPGITFSPVPGTLDFDNQGRPATTCNTTCLLNSAAYTATLAGGGASVVVTVDPVTGFQR